MFNIDLHWYLPQHSKLARNTDPADHTALPDSGEVELGFIEDEICFLEVKLDWIDVELGFRKVELGCLDVELGWIEVELGCV